MKEVTVDPELIREAGENEEAFEKLLAACRNHIRFRVYRTTHRIIEEDDDGKQLKALTNQKAHFCILQIQS